MAILFTVCILIDQKFPLMPRKTVYNRIKAVIAEQGKTSLWLSKELNVNKTTVSKWCRNEMQPTVAMLFKIAASLNVEARSLLVQGNRSQNSK